MIIHKNVIVSKLISCQLITSVEMLIFQCSDEGNYIVTKHYSAKQLKKNFYAHSLNLVRVDSNETAESQTL